MGGSCHRLLSNNIYRIRNMAPKAGIDGLFAVRAIRPPRLVCEERVVYKAVLQVLVSPLLVTVGRSVSFIKGRHISYFGISKLTHTVSGREVLFFFFFFPSVNVCRTAFTSIQGRSCAGRASARHRPELDCVYTVYALLLIARPPCRKRIPRDVVTPPTPWSLCLQHRVPQLAPNTNSITPLCGSISLLPIPAPPFRIRSEATN